MPRTPGLCHPETVHAASRQAEADTIAAELAAIARTGMVLPGSITLRRTRCGRRNCGCHADPPRLHGPYWQWTRKVAAKTICRWLSDDQHRDYQPWIDNDRRLHALLTRLEALGTATFEADPRWQQRGRTSPVRRPEAIRGANWTQLQPGPRSCRDCPCSGLRSYVLRAALSWTCSTARRIIGVARWIDRLTRCPGL